MLLHSWRRWKERLEKESHVHVTGVVDVDKSQKRKAVRTVLYGYSYSYMYLYCLMNWSYKYSYNRVVDWKDWSYRMNAASIGRIDRTVSEKWDKPYCVNKNNNFIGIIFLCRPVLGFYVVFIEMTFTKRTELSPVVNWSKLALKASEFSILEVRTVTKFFIFFLYCLNKE